MNGRIYTIEEIKEIVAPIALKYGVERVFLFGSYANEAATYNSDVDLRIDKGEINGLFRLAGFYRELEENFDVPIDVLTTGALSDEFIHRIKESEVILYER